MKKVFSLLCIMLITKGFYGLAQDNTVVQFRVNSPLPKGVKNLGVRGNLSPLSWEKTFSLQDKDNDGIFEGALAFPNKADAVLEYKYVYGDKNTVWELEGQNRILVLDEAQIQLNDQWNVLGKWDPGKIPALSGEQLTEDFELLKKALLEIHPGLYRYQTPQELDSVFNHFQSVFSQPQTYQAAFLNFTRLTAAIQCGHTFPSFYNQNAFIKAVVLDQNDKLPFTFRVLDGKMFLAESVVEKENLPWGTEILAIDGVPAKTFLKAVASLVKADGPNDAKRYADLNTFGTEANFEAFDCYFPLLYPPAGQQYLLTIRKPNRDSTEEVRVGTVSRAERTSALKKQNPGLSTKTDQLWKLAFWENNTAYLQLGTFDVFQLSFEWNKFLKNAFLEIKQRKVKNLVIDIRWNEGGQDEVLLFLGQSIVKQPIKIKQRQGLVRYQKVSPGLKPYLSTWDNAFFDLSKQTKPFNNAFFALSGENTVTIKPFDHAFDGNTYLLVNAANSSATFYLAEIAKENKLATLVGETTGGSQKGLNAGTMFFLRLPHSKIEIDLPIIGNFSDDKPAGGIQPDIVVPETFETMLKGEDPVIATLKTLLPEK